MAATNSQLSALVEVEVRLDRELAEARLEADRLEQEAAARIAAADVLLDQEIAEQRARLTAELDAEAAAQLAELTRTTDDDIATFAAVQDARASAIAHELLDALLAYVRLEGAT